MAGELARERFDVVRAESTLTFFALSSAQSVYGRTNELSGSIEAAWNEDGTIAFDPPPQMHVECRVESLRTGNELQDQEMWKLIDSKRFPKIAADLRAGASAPRGRCAGVGQITLAGLARTYEGEFSLERDGKRVTIEGDLEVDVRNFGLKPINLLVLSVAPLVKVRLYLVASRRA